MTSNPQGPWLLLTGMMGAGKSSTGAALARALGLPFVDLDDAIAQRMDEAVPALFARLGEPGFRLIEQNVVDDLVLSAGSRPLIVALGGGTYVQPGAPERLRHAGITVYLNASQDELERRLDAHQRAERPLLASPEALGTLLRQRQPLYQAAELTVPVDGRSVEQVAGSILDALPAGALPFQAVPVNLGERAYPIWITAGGAAQAAALAGLRLRALPSSVGKLFVLRDAGLPEVHSQTFLSALRAQGWSVHDLAVGPGEGAKSPEVLAEVWGWLIQGRVHRGDVVLALGGGVIGDLAGFAAATALRGVRCLQLPTTLLSMVDASVGGKTGINLGGMKNLIGAFHQPIGVVIAADVLATLPERERASGLGEVIKYALLEGEEALEALEARADALQQHDPQAWLDLIARCCATKARFVTEDEHDRGQRALLNLGHTFGHAIEALGHLGELAHGAAVGLGILLAVRAAALLGVAEADPAAALHDRVARLMARCGLPTDPSPYLHDPGAFKALMAGDKKAQGDAVTLVLPRRAGEVLLHPVTLDQLDPLLQTLALGSKRP